MEANKTMKDKTKQEEVLAQQVKCCACESHRLQLVLVTSYKKKSLLDMLCMTCGLLQKIELGGGIEIETKQIETKTLPGYPG